MKLKLLIICMSNYIFTAHTPPKLERKKAIVMNIYRHTQEIVTQALQAQSDSDDDILDIIEECLTVNILSKDISPSQETNISKKIYKEDLQLRPIPKNHLQFPKEEDMIFDPTEGQMLNEENILGENNGK